MALISSGDFGNIVTNVGMSSRTLDVKMWNVLSVYTNDQARCSHVILFRTLGSC
jgi:hypothetical protein